MPPPQDWNPGITALQLALLYDYEVYGRCSMYGESYVTSGAWKATKTRDNQWVTFQHYKQECALAICTAIYCYFSRYVCYQLQQHGCERMHAGTRRKQAPAWVA